MEQFQGKSAVVTGAASGIGFSLAKKCVEEGMHVLMSDIDATALDAAVEKLANDNAQVIGLQGDVSKAADIEALAAKAKEAFGEINLVCNNAGVINGANLWESTVDEYNWVMGVNLWGVIHSIRTFVPILKEQEAESHILNTVSMGAFLNLPYNGIYHMTKSAVLSLSECLYQELAIEAPNVGVTALCPEFVKTNLMKAENHKPAGMDSADTPIREILLQTLEGHLTSDEAAPPEALADRAFTAISEKRLFSISEPENAWTVAMNVRFDSIKDSGNPPFILPTNDGVAEYK